MPPNNGQLDLVYLEEMSAGDSQFLQELLSTYVETATDLIKSIEFAAEEGATEKAIYSTHTLKGSSRSIGAEPMGELCQAMEQAARQGNMPLFIQLSRGIPAMFSKLRGEIDMLLLNRAA
ncbi:MAG: two-component system, sensor histidine kinase and response regulator [Fimbriimonadaceae bacterium]|jgi:HPt (histidine-containing phosphotransfer) domain-containing protein|nr:two-component system, sensor histidine kinase and response regulator [Fimbriimonadaceae bacterium]